MRVMLVLCSFTQRAPLVHAPDTGRSGSRLQQGSRRATWSLQTGAHACDIVWTAVQRRGWLGATVAAAVAIALPITAAHATSSGSSSSAGFGSDWLVYHQDPLGGGVDPSGTDLSPATPAWTSGTLDGALFGEPLVDSGRVIVATEDDTVYELAADAGAVIWSTHVGTPVPSGNLPCGDISPTVGITGTPVIDPARDEVFAVTDERAGSSAQHFLVGLDLDSGAVLLHQAISLPGSDQSAQLQRTGLALDGTRVVMGFGGNSGDCGNYHGWVVSVPEGGGAEQTFEVASASGDSQGAVWMGGAAPIVDGAGNIWVATGNSAFSSSTDTYDNSDGVIELSAGLAEKQFFAPSSWYSDNASDSDLGSSAPVLLGNGLAFQAGKSRTAYALAQSALGAVGGQLASAGSYCGADVDGGSAVVGDIVYTPCQGGVVATQVAAGSPPTITSLWQTSTRSGGPPVVAGGYVWSIDPDNATLYGLNPSTGGASQAFSLGSEPNHFPTPTVADGLLLAPSSDRVYAFDGPAGLPPPPATGFHITTASLPPATRGVRYGWPLQATGGMAPYRWRRIGGTLPPGLRLRADGTLSGTPRLHQSTGDFTFTVQATTHRERGHPKQSATQSLTLTLA
jgi:outer membrane protein assembly factor BamB